MKTQAQELEPTNPSLIEFEVDLAQTQVWLAELKSRNPGVEASAWVRKVTKSSVPPEPAVAPEDPLDAEQNKAIREVLEKEIALAFPDEVPLSDLWNFVRQATVSPKLPEGIPIYVEPKLLEESGITSDTPVRIQLEGVTLRTSLQLVLSQFNLTFEIRSGLLSIRPRPFFVPESKGSSVGTPDQSKPYDVTGGSDWSRARGPLYVEASPLFGLSDSTPVDQERTARIQNALSRVHPMNFPMETPLRDVLGFVQASTATGELPEGIPIYVDPVSLEDAGVTLDAPVQIDLSGVRLKTTLELTLRQLGLTYVIRQGVVIFLTPEKLVTMPNPGERSEFEQMLQRSNSGGFGMGGMGGGMMGAMGGGMMGGMGGSGFR